MYPEFARNNIHWKLGFPFLLALLLLTINIGASNAALTSTSKGFSFKSVPGIRGTRTYIYTADPSLPLGSFIAGLTAVCNSSGINCPSSSYWFETGWIKGTQTYGKIKHYISWNGAIGSDYRYGIDISKDSWYLFQSLYSNSEGRWEGWIDGVPRLYIYNLGITSGTLAACALESKHLGSTPFAYTYCDYMRYKVGTGSWTYYDYTHELEDPYCVMRPWTYGMHAYGPPSGSCP